MEVRSFTLPVFFEQRNNGRHLTAEPGLPRLALGLITITEEQDRQRVYLLAGWRDEALAPGWHPTLPIERVDELGHGRGAQIVPAAPDLVDPEPVFRFAGGRHHAFDVFQD